MSKYTEEPLFTFDVPQKLLISIRDALHFVVTHKEQYTKEQPTADTVALTDFKEVLNTIVVNREFMEAFTDETRPIN